MEATGTAGCDRMPVANQHRLGDAEWPDMRDTESEFGEQVPISDIVAVWAE